jgi:hypothetical protein
MNTMKIRLALLILLFGCGVATAQIQIDEVRPAPPGGEVEVENMFGTIEVVAWDRNEIHVTGRMAAGAEGFEFEIDEETGETEIYVEAPDHWFYESDDDSEYRSELVVQVPRGSSISIETINATVKVDGISGAVEVETVNGSVTIAGDPSTVEIESMTGDVDVRAQAAQIDVEAVSGSVLLFGATGSVEVECVSGEVVVQGAALGEVSVETVSGPVTIDVSVAEQGEINVETHSGDVELLLPSDIQATFSISTFNGTIVNEVGPNPSRPSVATSAYSSADATRGITFVVRSRPSSIRDRPPGASCSGPTVSVAGRHDNRRSVWNRMLRSGHHPVSLR